MKKATLEKLFKENKTTELEWQYPCHDCKKDISVVAILNPETGEITIDGGAVYDIDNIDNIDDIDDIDDEYYVKCDDCFSKDNVLRNFRKCAIYSRVVGYMRPVSSWNKGKQEEFKNRKNFKVLEQAVF